MRFGPKGLLDSYIRKHWVDPTTYVGFLITAHIKRCSPVDTCCCFDLESICWPHASAYASLSVAASEKKLGKYSMLVEVL